MNTKGGNTFSEKVVDILKRERIKRGISQYSIAQNCCISKSALSAIEKNINSPTLYSLIIISDYLDVKLSDIIKSAENEFNS